MFIASIAVLLLIGAAALIIWRIADMVARYTVWNELTDASTTVPGKFSADTVAGLPEPAQRYFKFAIRPDTPLHTVAEISMHGELSLGTRQSPDYAPMAACQVLSPPHGFVWHVAVGRGVMQMTGSDAAYPGGSWTRFWMFGILPVARVGGTADHGRSAFGRYMGEAIFWSPASLLPSEFVRWELAGPDSATVTIRHGQLEQSFELIVDEKGQPNVVKFMRWSNENADKEFRRQPFGAYLSEFRRVDGYMLPTRVVAGNHFDTDAYFPFYKATIDNVRFVRHRSDARFCR